jgi:DNA-binding response OmpR family regulator
MDEPKSVVLVIEDDEAIGDVIKIVLSEEFNYEVFCFTNCVEVLPLIQKMHPALMLLDYQLPNMSGLQFYDHIQKLDTLEPIPTIMMSANLPWQELKKRQIIGLQKPFDIDELLQLVQDIIATSPVTPTKP